MSRGNWCPFLIKFSKFCMIYTNFKLSINLFSLIIDFRFKNNLWFTCSVQRRRLGHNQIQWREVSRRSCRNCIKTVSGMQIFRKLHIFSILSPYSIQIIISWLSTDDCLDKTWNFAKNMLVFFYITYFDSSLTQFW